MLKFAISDKGDIIINCILLRCGNEKQDAQIKVKNFKCSDIVLFTSEKTSLLLAGSLFPDLGKPNVGLALPLLVLFS